MTVLFCSALAVLVIGSAAQGPPGFENLPEECRPRRPHHGEEREVCCQMPAILSQDRTVMMECASQLGLPMPGPPPTDGSAPPKPPAHRACVDECIFNKQGLLTADMKLNPEAILKKEMEIFSADAVWSQIAQEAVASCLQAPATIPPDGQCKSGAMEFKRCLHRTMYMNCPTDLRSQTETCNNERALMERCPNMGPPPPPRPAN